MRSTTYEIISMNFLNRVLRGIKNACSLINNSNCQNVSPPLMALVLKATIEILEIKSVKPIKKAQLLW